MRLKRYYDNDEYNLAFDRWTTFMAEMIIKHAPEVLEKLDQTQKDVTKTVDYMVFWRSSEIGVERNMLIEHNAA
ncbi:hypothetical protein SAMN05216515_1436 [Eubacterium pyruvativorans]|uniref:Uncharacterized protein n=1 Tax=Eubacterium pyruvativorans TaxID=155865 RepID=A0A1I7IE99_9FIRM|nr:hypothetical protein [Eubacterium pyruvativorans]SFO40344.1 hypothetical protein SAMN05216515_1436 [Eubacterium pyruvativorans]SFU71264.1 hypothetical protein SAMN05216508_1426 [Eubacterium pyruvativorans]